MAHCSQFEELVNVESSAFISSSFCSVSPFIVPVLGVILRQACESASLVSGHYRLMGNVCSKTLAPWEVTCSVSVWWSIEGAVYSVSLYELLGTNLLVCLHRGDRSPASAHSAWVGTVNKLYEQTAQLSLVLLSQSVPDAVKETQVASTLQLLVLHMILLSHIYPSKTPGRHRSSDRSRLIAWLSSMSARGCVGTARNDTTCGYMLLD